MEIEIKTTVDIPATADHWQLYRAPHADQAAEQIVGKLKSCVESGLDWVQTTVAMEAFMATLASEYGASDSEPLAVLWHWIDRIYGATTN